MSNKEKLKKILAISTLILLTSMSNVEAHSGRTDSNGGHKDNKNASGLGSYHYHHGYGPHLHTNGCPYSSENVSKPESVVSSTGSTGQSTGISKEQERKNKEEKDKKEASDRGYNDGYKSAYSGSLVDAYSGEYSIIYDESYEKGKLAGEEKLLKDANDAYDKAYNLGFNGEVMIDYPYNNEVLNSKYKEGYEEGKNKYVEIKTDEYSKSGFEDGKNDKNKDITNIESEFISIYEDNYKKGQTELSKEYKERGYYKAFEQKEYISPNFENDKYVNWYKEGYDNGVAEVEQLKSLAYNDGYEGKESKIPKNFNHAKDIYIEHYNKGKEVKSKENMKIGIGVTSAALIGVGGTYYYKSKKKSKYDEIDKFKK